MFSPTDRDPCSMLPVLHRSIACKWRDACGQATVEAAFVLPILMLLFLMMLQPAICLYDHIVMRGAAAEGCRLLTTASADASSTNEDYIRRRLSAIPDIPIFHIHSGECSYEIEMTGNEASEQVSVRITNEVKPLPLLDIAMSLASALNDGGNLELEVEVVSATQPSWAASSGEGDMPKDWVNVL